jgi:integrase
MPIYAYKGKRGITYHIIYFVNGKRKKETIGGDKKLAEVVLHKRLTEIAEGKYLDVKREEKIKFEDFADHYLEVYCKPNHKSFKSDINNIKALKRFFAGKYLYEITSEDVEKFKAERIKEGKKGITPATVNRSLAWLKSMFNRAIEWKKVKDNPVCKVKLFKENNQRLRYLEKEEITKLLDNCFEHLRPIVIVALHTGMRKGEILNLKWRDVDFKRDIIYLYNTKNGERREVPMNDLVKKTLITVRKHPNSPYIFCNKKGKPYGDIKKSFFTACENTGIMNFHFHDLRHTFASHLAMRSVDLNRIRKLLGHKTLQMTFRYAHLSPGYLKQAVDILAQDFCENKVKTAPKLPQEEILKIGEDSVLLEPIDNKELVV